MNHKRAAFEGSANSSLTRANDGNSDFSLKKMVFSREISAKVQSGMAFLVIVPFDPQPVIDSQQLATLGLSIDDSPALVAAVRMAFNTGQISRDIAPIEKGNAFSLLQEISAQKLANFGTGRVKHLDIARFADLSARDWHACGYATQAEFHKYWAQTLPSTPAESNPWCWLIKFEFKG